MDTPISQHTETWRVQTRKSQFYLRGFTAQAVRCVNKQKYCIHSTELHVGECKRDLLWYKRIVMIYSGGRKISLDDVTFTEYHYSFFIQRGSYT